MGGGSFEHCKAWSIEEGREWKNSRISGLVETDCRLRAMMEGRALRKPTVDNDLEGSGLLSALPQCRSDRLCHQLKCSELLQGGPPRRQKVPGRKIL